MEAPGEEPNVPGKQGVHDERAPSEKVPAGHIWHLPTPVAEKKPGLHAGQTDCPVRRFSVPGGHQRHEPLPTVGLNMPAAQSSQLPMRSLSWNLPTGHCVQAAAVPTAGAKLPASHSSQTQRPVRLFAQPTEQGVQTVAARPAKRPAGQSVHEVWPGVAENLPGAHCSGTLVPTLGKVLGCWQNHPAEQGVHCVAPKAEENVPAGQLVQAMAPGVARNIPTAHCGHSVAPELGWKDPALQGTHEAPDRLLGSQYVPGLQGVQTAAPVSETRPTGQFMQTTAPAELYWLGLHKVQREAATPENAPAGHLVHELCPIRPWKNPAGHGSHLGAPAVA